MGMFQPACPSNMNRGSKEYRRSKCELVAIEVLKTGIIPERNCRDIAMLTKFLKEVNKFRQTMNVQLIPHDVFNQKI
jgi:hypothetical protein